MRERSCDRLYTYHTTFPISIQAQHTRNKLVHYTLTAMKRHSTETAAPKRPSIQRVSAETVAPLLCTSVCNQPPRSTRPSILLG